MANVNLSNVDISIQQFQRISSGTINAGEVRLAGERGLARMNHHVFFTICNGKTLAHDEVLTIKNAFVKALQGNGVGDSELDSVRRELGLAPDGAADRSLAERSIRPLSRQKIREILDRNANTINAGHEQPPIRTTRDLQAGLDRGVKDTRTTTRNTTNERSDARRRLPAANHEVSLFLDLLSGNALFHGAADHEALFEMARRQKAEILHAGGGQPGEERPCVVKCHLDKGLTIEMSTGCSEAEYLARLDDILVRFGSVPPADERTLAVRREFGEKRTPQEKNNWIRGLRNDPEYGFKLRTAVVAALAEQGVDDHTTLSAVNRLAENRLALLLETILFTARELRGDALRNYSIVRLDVMRAELNSVDVPEEQRAYIPAVPPGV